MSRRAVLVSTSLFALVLVAQNKPAPVPVIVELFTSEGCSSCPPADEVLARLEGHVLVSGAEVIALGEHVTYWDRLGWKDPFSQKLFTERQEQYGRRFHLNSVYTPQVVVNGDAEMLGSDETAVRKEIAKAAMRPQAKIELTLASEGVLSYRITGLPQNSNGADAFLAVTESRMETNVRSGENSGRVLRHTGVVRSLEALGHALSGETHLRLDSAWKRDNLKYVVFVQDRATRKIWAAARLEPGVIEIKKK